jgi:hypothetical protein
MVGAFGVLRASNPVERRRTLRFTGLGAAIALAMVVAGPASAWPWQTDWVSALKRIHTVDGPNAYDRMRACGLRIDRHLSFVADAQLTRKRGKPGDLVVQVAFEAPKIPGDKHRQRDLIAEWYLPKSGEPAPWNQWADQIQNADQVMWLHCQSK